VGGLIGFGALATSASQEMNEVLLLNPRKDIKPCPSTCLVVSTG
jgi:hypothetical protein